MTKYQKKYHRLILKLSGEALLGDEGSSISVNFIKRIARDISELHGAKFEIGIVIGGGNFFRGAKLKDGTFSRLTGDYLGMIATMMNAIAIADVFNRLNIPTQVVSPLPISGLIEQYNCKDVDQYLKDGKVVIFAAGTGNPFVTTDTALCLRGIELKADLLLKATNVDGVYSSDPKKNSRAKVFTTLTYDEAITKNLAVMDMSAFCLGREHNMRLVVFNINKRGAILKIAQGMREGTLIAN